MLEAGTTHVVAIVDDVLIAGALASGAFTVARERLCLETRVLDPAWRMVAMQRSQREKLQRLRLSRSAAPDVPAEIMGDGTRLTQVLVNIISNSVKFTPEGGAISLRVDIALEPPAGCAPAPEAAERHRTRWLRLCVSDTGIGVAAGALPAVLVVVSPLAECRNTAPPLAENLERIFRPFEQAEQSTVRQYGGTGLGLTVRSACARLQRTDCRFSLARDAPRRSVVALRAQWAAI